jgi:hypothetical protein
VAKSGLAALKGTAKSIGEAYSLIMDASISVGDQQLLLLLKAPAKHPRHLPQAGVREGSRICGVFGADRQDKAPGAD